MALSEYLVTDDLTILLGLITASIFLLYNLYKPQSLIHPILLGRQSDVARVRMPGESAVHRNYTTGLMGRFTIRPSREAMTLLDLIKPGSDAPRSLWSTKISNPQLAARVAAFGTGLSRAGLTRESNVLLLLNDSIEFLITELALAAHSIPSFTLTSPALLSPVFDLHPPTAIVIDGAFLPHVLELIYESKEAAHHVVVVVGEANEKVLAEASRHIKLVRWADVEAEGAAAAPVTAPAPGQPCPQCAHATELKYRCVDPSDVFTVSFYSDAAGQLQGTQLTHENITAGVTAIRVLLPASAPLTSLDTIVSAHSLSTAFGRAIAYTALYEGTSFATLESSKLFRGDTAGPSPPIVDLKSTQLLGLPSPTVLFIKPDHLDVVANAILASAKSSFLFSIAWRHKLAALLEGFSTKESLWDRLVFDAARSAVLGDAAPSVRAAVISGGPVPASLLTPARIALSVPLVLAHAHPLVAAPVLASHPQDVQTFAAASEREIAHVGPPTVNVEVKLVGVRDDAVERGEDPEGVLHVRGPIVGRVLAVSDGSEEAARAEEPWVSTGDRARVQTNGSFKAWSETKA
ncbi:acetyl-CoA synthetase-like protein [Gloeopeniophorella convolvens]|nr:acetyl-CoA synthetase-like protein [Gloeopeniophorella convolvens]